MSTFTETTFDSAQLRKRHRKTFQINSDWSIRMTEARNEGGMLPRPKAPGLPKPGLPKPGLPKPGLPKPSAIEPTRDQHAEPTFLKDGAPLPAKASKTTEARFDATVINEMFERIQGADEIKRVGGRYEVLRLIARGGMGEVWLAKDLKVSGRHVAVKRLTAESANSDKLRSRFKAEAATMAKLRHVNTIQVIDVGSDENGPFICMEYVPGPKRAVTGWSSELPAKPLTLQDHIAENGPITVADAARMLLKLCDVTSEAHSLDIIHRDIKPANVLLSAKLEGEKNS